MSEPKEPKPFSDPSLEVNKIRKRIRTGHQSAIDALSAQITLLQKYFRTRGLPAEAVQELDEFIMDVQDRWTVAAEAIEDILEGEQNSQRYVLGEGRTAQ
jgi:hypothetical protein